MPLSELPQRHILNDDEAHLGQSYRTIRLSMGSMFVQRLGSLGGHVCAEPHGSEGSATGNRKGERREDRHHLEAERDSMEIDRDSIEHRLRDLIERFD